MMLLQKVPHLPQVLLHSNLSRAKCLHSVVWKFFSALQGRKSVQCKLCPVGNKDDLLAWRHIINACEHLKRCRYTAFCELRVIQAIHHL